MRVFEWIHDYLPEELKRLPFLDSGFYMERFSDFYKEPGSDALFKKYQIPHKRNFFEITLVIRESTNVNIGGITYSGTTNALELVSPYQVFSMDYGSVLQKVNSLKHDEVYTIFFKPSFLNPARQSYEIQNDFPFFKLHTMPAYQLSTEQMRAFSRIVEAMYEEAKYPKGCSIQILQSYLQILLYMIKQEVQNEVVSISNNRFELITSKFEQLISTHSGVFLSIGDYASRLNISPIYLSECVKKATGKSAQQVLIDYRILFAKALLHQVGRSITEIAQEIGFSEVTNFTKFFKKNTGLTPNQFRNRK
ncbi:AraC family transcriptional regulator [Marinilabiliaceae bacterium JC017]|nr:AraC family transcriptional regulator [Marinilabiliaceae bacterium JC017]